jgi:TolB-like protein/tetratricopeptide (TPR) repeat protein
MNGLLRRKAVNHTMFARKTRVRDAASGRKLAQFYLRGPMRVVGPEGEDLLPAPRKVRAMLAYLCLAPTGPTPRSRLRSLLWNGALDTQAAANNLRHALWQLSTTINGQVPGLIVVRRDTVQLARERCWIDVAEDLTREERLLEDLDGITTPFDQWLMTERRRIDDQARTALEQELQRLIEDGAGAELRAAAARRLTNFDATHEGAVRALMSAFYDMGEPAQAIREYERCRRAMHSANLPMSNQTIALHETIRLVSAERRTTKRTVHPQPLVADHDTSAPDGHASIAVLPFNSLTDVPHYDYVAAGVEDNLVEGLSRIPELFVVSRMSTLGFRGESRVPQELGEILGVRYVISGKMGVIGDRIGLAAQLNDSKSEIPIWSCNLEERRFDWIEVNERLVNSVVRRVAPQSSHTAGRPPVAQSEAYELLLRAQENMHNSSRVVFTTCEHLLDAAIEQQPGFAAALAWRARWHLLNVAQGWSSDTSEDAKKADYFAKRAIQCDRMEPMALAVYAYVAAYLHKDFDLALQRFEAALRVNPNSAPAWFWSATVQSWLGHGRCGIQQITRALALSPFDPLMYAYNTTATLAYLVDGQYHRAIEFGMRAIQENRSHLAAYVVLTVSLIQAGQYREGYATARELLKLEPGFSVDSFRKRSPTSLGPHGELLCDALARAGIPLSA